MVLTTPILTRDFNIQLVCCHIQILYSGLFHVLCDCCLVGVLILEGQMTIHNKKDTRNLISVYFPETDPLP